MNPASALSRLEFSDPPVVEVAVGVEFRPLSRFRGIDLGPLRETWGAEYPNVEEKPPLPPTSDPLGGEPGGFNLQLQLGSAPPPARYWFLDAQQTQLIQVQADRLVVNWRALAPETPYPGFDALSAMCRRRFEEFSEFARRADIGVPVPFRVDLTYINAIPLDGDRLPALSTVLRSWAATPQHHLGEPAVAKIGAVYPVPDGDAIDGRLVLTVDPALHQNGTSVLLYKIALLARPLSATLDGVMEALVDAHAHVRRSFDELTDGALLAAWGKAQ